MGLFETRDTNFLIRAQLRAFREALYIYYNHFKFSVNINTFCFPELAVYKEK